MFEDAVTTIAALSDLHLRHARATGRLPDEHHEPRPYRAAGYVNQTNRNALTSTNTRSHNTIKPGGTSQVELRAGAADLATLVELRVERQCVQFGPGGCIVPDSK